MKYLQKLSRKDYRWASPLVSISLTACSINEDVQGFIRVRRDKRGPTTPQDPTFAYTLSVYKP